MLPPVRAALNSNTDLQSLMPTAAARASLAVATTVAKADHDATAPISSGRMDALSLSAQLKLAQSFSIFAETIGKVLNMPRGENEALVDYATRLSEAVRTLNPGERMAIERLLNQIVKGVTLRLLAEILNNPAGPDAARLAAYIEAASAGERDLAAKAVVSSYRQNASAEPAAGNASRTLTGAGAQTAMTPRATATPGAAMAITNAAPIQTPTPSVAGPQQVPQHGAEVPQQSRDETSAQAARTDAKPSGQERPASPAPQSHPAANRSATATRAQLMLAANGTMLPGLPTQPASAASTLGAITPSATAPGSEDGDGGGGHSLRAQAGAAKGGDDGRNGQRHAETGMRTPPTDGRAGLSNARLMLAELASWMAGVVSDAASPAGASTRPAAPTVPSPAEQAIIQEEDSGSEGAAKQTAGASRNSGPAEASTVPRPAETPGAEGARSSQTENSELLDRQMAMLAGGLPQAVREGVPLPHVAYPPGEQEPEREDRKARAIAEIGDEEDEPPAQDHGFDRDQQDQEDHDPLEDAEESEAEDSKAAVAAVSDLPSEEDEGRPNDLYWRMAGWA